jgi:PAS domain-containing protein
MQPPDGPPDPATERALALVEEATRALEERDREIQRLRALTERLLEHAPVAAVLDDRSRVRGWSRRAERILAVPTDRAVGRPASAVLDGIDLMSLHAVQRIAAPEGRVEVVVEPIGPDSGDLLVRFA